MYSLIYCSWNFPEVMGLKLTEGRLFREGDNGPVLLTQGMRAHGAKLEAYEELGEVSPVVGFVEDVNITSLRKADSPVGFLAIDPKKNLTLPYAYIRLSEGADRFATVDKIQSVLKEMDSAMPFEVKFYDSIGKNLYSGEEQLRLSVWLFSLLAVLLSLVGIWGICVRDSSGSGWTALLSRSVVPLSQDGLDQSSRGTEERIGNLPHASQDKTLRCHPVHARNEFSE